MLFFHTYVFLTDIVTNTGTVLSVGAGIARMVLFKNNILNINKW